MKEEYDFSHGTRGRFFKPEASLVPPIHLEPAILDFLTLKAKAHGKSLDALVNDLLRKNIELARSLD